MPTQSEIDAAQASARAASGGTFSLMNYNPADPVTWKTPAPTPPRDAKINPNERT